MTESRFYLCRKCGNIVGMIHDNGTPLSCCGTEMEHLQPGLSDAAAEKHLPVITIETDTLMVSVGSELHPMTEEHHIQWVYLQTDRGGQRKCLRYSSEPSVSFALRDEHPVAVYAYCNLHGLWMEEI